jgi:hypothetical protein
MDRKLQSMIFHDRIDAANKMQTRQEKTDSPSTLDYSSVRMMAVDDEADITLTVKKELEQSGLWLDVFKNVKACFVTSYELQYESLHEL